MRLLTSLVLISLLSLPVAADEHPGAPTATPPATADWNTLPPRLASLTAANIGQLKRDALRGDAEAQYALGAAYLGGKFVKQDQALGMQWMKKSAASRYPRAIHWTAACYSVMLCGFPHDPAKSAALARTGVGLGYPPIEWILAKAYHDGKGVPTDYNQAFRLFRSSAEQGYAPAQEDLGMMYLRGDVSEADSPNALIWLRKAADAGQMNAAMEVASLYEFGVGLPGTDSKLAAHYYLAAAEGRQYEATYYLAGEYRKNGGFPPDPVQAYAWYKIASHYLRAEALGQLADLERAEVAKSMTAAQIQAGNKQAEEWIAKHD